MRGASQVGLWVIAAGAAKVLLGIGFIVSPWLIDGGIMGVISRPDFTGKADQAMGYLITAGASMVIGAVLVPAGAVVGAVGFGLLLGGVATSKPSLPPLPHKEDQ